MSVIAADGVIAGTVTDLWVDRAEHVIRYLEIDTGSKKILAPMAMSKVKGRLGQVEIDAINAADFAGVPTPETAGQVTFYEEERIVAYFGGGYLYANRERQEPLI
jgi:photosynthetic reaction center H subunit